MIDFNFLKQVKLIVHYRFYLNNKCNGYFKSQRDCSEQQYHNNQCKNKPNALYYNSSIVAGPIVYSLCKNCFNLMFNKRDLIAFTDKEIFTTQIL